MASPATAIFSILAALARIPSDSLNSTTISNSSTPSNTSSSAYFSPSAGTTWNIQLETVPEASAADNSSYAVWDYDMADADNSTITAFKAQGRKVICYFSAGSREKGRDDYNDFPSQAVGKVMDGWPDENWVDTRNIAIRQIMANRIALAAAKGCDGVDPDNIDGYDNDTGFNLTSDDGVDYVKFLAQTAHNAGLGYGLKNGGDIVDRVVDVAQWCIQEQCHVYKVSDPGPSECSLYQPFIQQNKPVFNIEYTKSEPASDSFIHQSCTDPAAQGFSVLMKHMSLNAWAETCP